MDAEPLRHLIAEYHSRLAAIFETEADRRASSSWTRKQTLGHLIDSAANNHQRFIRLQQGPLSGFPGYEQQHWVNAGAYVKNTWSNLLELWTQYNLQLALVIETIDPAHKDALWTDKSYTLEYLVTDYVRHMRHHLEQIDKA